MFKMMKLDRVSVLGENPKGLMRCFTIKKFNVLDCQCYRPDHIYNPKCLGITLDRVLIFRTHCEAEKMKIITRNNLILKLTKTKW